MLAILARVIVGAGVLLAAVAAEAAPEKRVALVIGNGAYVNSIALKNPVNDARAMSEKLRGLGFAVVDGYDLDRLGFERTVREFASLARDADLSLFFYAGHGIAADEQNYLLPVDVKLEDETALQFEAMAVDTVTRMMRYSDGVSLIFLDACRNNPFTRAFASKTRSTVGTGLAEMRIVDPGKGLAIAFATSPGTVAKDGAGDHSPFTQALLEHIDTANMDITQVMSQVTGDVLKLTDDTQRPWMNTSLTGPVMLNPMVAALSPDPNVMSDAPNPAAATVAAAAAVSPLGVDPTETLLFNIARETNDINDYRAYLDRFPSGLFAANARNAIDRLSAAVVANVAPAAIVPAAAAATAVAAATAEPARAADGDDFELPITDAVKSAPADATTETALEMDRDKMRDVQNRLNIAGAAAGRADGSFGKGTRAAIKRWQAANGLPETGFLNSLQLAVLTSQTEGEAAAEVKTAVVEPAARTGPAPETRAAPTRRSTGASRSVAPQQKKVTPKATRPKTSTKKTTRTASSAQKKTSTRSSGSRSRGDGGAGAETFGRFVGGVARGMLNY